MFNLQREKAKKYIFLSLQIVFTVLTFVGAFLCITDKVDDAGYAIIPVPFNLAFGALYRNSKKAIEENTKFEDVTETENKICQSCGMPITSNEQLGTNVDGSINNDYCKYCYENGEFIDKVTMEEYIEMCSQYGSQAGMTDEEMKEHCTKLFPSLKRWKND